MKPLNDALQAVFKNSVVMGRSYRIPKLEMALVSKFAVMVSPCRDQDKRLIDGGDFVNIVVNNLADIRINKLRRLANLVHQDGGAQILKMIEDIKAGRRIQF